MHKKTTYLILIIFTLIAAGCSSKANDDTTASAVAENDAATEIVRGVEQTAEAKSAEETQAAEDEAATQEALSAKETEDAKATAESAKNIAATKKAEEHLAVINEVLLQVGHSTSTGRLAWEQSDPDTINLAVGNPGIIAEFGGDTHYANFVIHFNITWESSSSEAGCDLWFRSEQNHIHGKKYTFRTARYSGQSAWDVELWHEIQRHSIATGSFQFTSDINFDNGAVNNYILVAEGNLLTVYINGKRVSSVTVDARSEGRFSLFVWQKDGETTCTFADTWVWNLP